MRPDDAEWHRLRQQAQQLPCAECDGPAGVTCKGLDGVPLVKFPAHPKRMKHGEETT